mmetsp:Transcript_96605/g.207247  ORF Transcript_96605/g.207247 Transcript_96605/m.207247 type:complete len:235 (+) Transcript_96605:823-1527(+)
MKTGIGSSTCRRSCRRGQKTSCILYSAIFTRVPEPRKHVTSKSGMISTMPAATAAWRMGKSSLPPSMTPSAHPKASSSSSRARSRHSGRAKVPSVAVVTRRHVATASMSFMRTAAWMRGAADSKPLASRSFSASMCLGQTTRSPSLDTSGDRTSNASPSRAPGSSTECSEWRPCSKYVNEILASFARSGAAAASAAATSAAEAASTASLSAASAAAAAFSASSCTLPAFGPVAV